ncbi:MAG TPA: DUF1127 domain-containing protein [Dongiaceae bacterium]|jgi:uncharacterized protein YjiS (DUF1127 family)|nr:DUF1127 domain-containing protein [Dongiaceae bacterium]
MKKTNIVSRLIAWQDRMWSRRELAKFDDFLLRDLGLSRADIDAEIDKPFWRV